MRLIKRTISVLCLSIAAILLVFGPLSSAQTRNPQSQKALGSKLNNVNQRMRNVQAQLRRAKARQKNITDQLVSTQRRLESAQDRVTSNKVQLMAAENKLKVINQRLVRTERQLNRRARLLENRLAALYEGEDINYLEVLLGSQNMQTMLTRSYYIREIVSSDMDLVTEIKREKESVENDKREQAAQVTRIAALQAELVRQRDKVSGLAGRQRDELNAVEHDRELYEHALADLAAESNRIEAIIRQYEASRKSTGGYKPTFSGGLMLPVNGRLTCKFGYRIHPITRAHSFHTGIDLAVPTGTPVKCAADGEVISAAWNGPYGYCVIVDHGGGVSTLYGHNSKLLVKSGQRVKQGEAIARSGSTGWSTGPHVHFEKRINGRAVNPL